MSETKGPWEHDGRIVYGRQYQDGPVDTEVCEARSEADAAHIVACVNGAAAAGVDSAALTQLHHEYSALETRADALAEENETLKRALAAMLDAYAPRAANFPEDSLHSAVRLARAALKVQP